MIEIIPSIDPTLDTETEENVAESNTDTQPRSMVTGTNDTNTTGGTEKIQTNIQQQISEDFAIPEEIASAALLMLQEMSQPNPQEPDDYDEYALPVGTERLPDIVGEMNEERGIKNVVNYDADIPEDMKLQTDEPRKEKTDKTDKDDESDETIIYDASEFIDANKRTQLADTTHTQKGNYEHRHME